MRKSKILGIALAAAMVASVATVSVSAKVSSAGIEGDTVGIVGQFNGWATDVPMTNNNGVWEGTIEIAEVTSDMVVKQAMKDDGTGGKVARDDVVGPAVTFKIRLNGSWDDSWGDYEPDYDRTWNSQTDCAVAATVGQPLTINVKLDTTKVVAGSSITDPSDPDAWNVWPVTYEVVGGGEASTDEPSDEPSEEAPADEPSEEAPSDEPSEEAPAEDDPSTTGEDTTSTQPAVESDTKDAAPVQTGDTASAAALVAVVLASLGVAVVMTKKASAKD